LPGRLVERREIELRLGEKWAKSRANGVALQWQLQNQVMGGLIVEAERE
jgi:hypothetical protein